MGLEHPRGRAEDRQERPEDLPEGLQIAACDHLEAAVAAGVAGELRDVVHASHEGDDDALRANEGKRGEKENEGRCP